jgi:flagellar motor switch protein FliN/FliY
MAGDSETIGQNEIDGLLRQAQEAARQENNASPPSPATEGTEQASKPALGAGEPPSLRTASAPRQSRQDSATAETDADDIQLLLDQAEQAIASVDQPADSAEGISPFQFKDLAGSPPSEEKATLDLLRDVELDVKIELGRTHMYLEEVLKLRRGSVVALDKLAGDPVDIYVNGRLIARGEVLVLNDNFCVRVAELITGDDNN